MKIKVLLALFALCLMFPSSAMAEDSGQEAAQKKFTGIYVPKNSVKKDRARINGIIEKIVSEMTFYKRPFARSTLEDSTKPCANVIVSFSGDDMTIHCKSYPKAKSPIDGTTVKYKNEDGEMMRLSQKLTSKKLIQRFQSENGIRKNVYTLRDAGKTLHLSVTITGEELPRPLKYTLEMKPK